MEKIQTLISGANADCEISSPMERLETFFVRTVAQAQKQAQPTSGAVSTRDIGGFLASDRARDDVLADLVSGSAGEKEIQAAHSPTQPVTKPTVRDEAVLDQLTGPTPVVPTQGGTSNTATTQPVETDTPSSNTDQVDKNLLDQLVDPSQEKAETTDLPKPTQEGEAGNA